MKMDDSKKLQNLKASARWSPNPKQQIALERPEFEIGFGGSRGGGKTDAGLSWLGYDSNCEKLYGVVLRKHGDDLKEWILRARARFVNENINATITGNPPVIRFPNNKGEPGKGATYALGHFKDAGAFTKYQGVEINRLLIEELELIPSEESYMALLASVRSTIPGIKAQVFSTFNPGGPGHTWIKRRFGLKGIPVKPVITKDARTGRMRIFIPARVEDNPQLVSNDPDYVHLLEGLPDGLREQWRWGSWDNPIIKGAYYTREMDQMQREKRIGDFPFFKEFGVHTFWDIGGDMTSIGFFQFIDPWWYLIDYHQDSGYGLHHYLALLQERQMSRGYRYASHHFPHDIRNKEWGSGRTRVEVLEEANINFDIVPDLSIDDGIDAFRIISTRLRIDQKNGAALIDALINYRQEWDEEKQVFKGKPLHNWASHPADMVRYFAVSNHGDFTPQSPGDALKKDIKEVAGPRRRSPEFGNGEYPQHGRFNYDG